MKIIEYIVITKVFIQVPDFQSNYRALNQWGQSTTSQICAARELNSLHVEQNSKKKRQIIPEFIEKEIALRAWKHGNSEARKLGENKYPQYRLARETVI